MKDFSSGIIATDCVSLQPSCWKVTQLTMHRLAGPAEEPVKLLTCPNFMAFIWPKHHVRCYLSSLVGNRKAAAPLALLATLVCANITPFRLCWVITLYLLCHTSYKYRAQFSPPIQKEILQDPCCTLLLVDTFLKIKGWLTALVHQENGFLVQAPVHFAKISSDSFLPFPSVFICTNSTFLQRQLKCPGQFPMLGYCVG